MKRLLSLFVAALFVVPAFGFDPRKPVTGRVTLLDAGGDNVTRTIRERLVRELKSRGFDVVDSATTFDEVQRNGRLSREDVRAVPTGVGIGSYRMSVWFALPWVRYRAAANAVAEIESIAAR